MSVAAEVNERLARITELGTSIWLDQIRLNLIESGELERLVKYESLRGVTSNPAILEKAILGSDDYDELIEEDTKKGLDARAIYDHLAVKTVQDACDVLRPVWEEAEGADGFVSIEVEPDIAFDTEKTMESARRYWKVVDRPNVMVKTPGTKNPNYPETKYVDSLVGPHTVNTMPMATLNAAGEHSEVDHVTVDQDPTPELEALREAGIDMDDVTAKLLRDGVDAFIKPFEKLLAGIESAREAINLGRPKTFDSAIPDELEEPLRKRLDQAVKEDVVRRIWHKDESLGGGPGVPEIGNRLGWLTIAQRMLDQCEAL